MYYFVTCTVLTERYEAVAMATPHLAVCISRQKQLFDHSVNHPSRCALRRVLACSIQKIKFVLKIFDILNEI